MFPLFFFAAIDFFVYGTDWKFHCAVICAWLCSSSCCFNADFIYNFITEKIVTFFMYVFFVVSHTVCDINGFWD